MPGADDATLDPLIGREGDTPPHSSPNRRPQRLTGSAWVRAP